MIKQVLILIALLLAATMLHAGKIIELEVFRDWRGNNSQFKSSRPFFTITDIYELEHFWSQANADEPMPCLNFDKYMLLVWNPGPSLFDHHPVKVDKFLYRDGRFFVIMELEKKDTGGYWRRPFVATLLPKIKKGDIFVMRKERVAYNKIEYRHEYTIWDMSSSRNMPFEVAKLDTFEKKPEFIDSSLHPQDQVVADATSEVQSPSPITIGRVSKPTVKKGAQSGKTVANSGKHPLAGDSGFDRFHAAPNSSTNSVTKPTTDTAKKEEKKNNDNFFPDFGSTKSATVSQSEPKSSAAVPSAVDEDPLFGEEFDINF